MPSCVGAFFLPTHFLTYLFLRASGTVIVMAEERRRSKSKRSRASPCVLLEGNHRLRVCVRACVCVSVSECERAR